MVLQTSHRNMFNTSNHSNRHQAFNLPQYPYTTSGMNQNCYSMTGNGMTDPNGLATSDAGISWHPFTAPSCSRAYEDWSPPPSASPHGSAASPGYGSGPGHVPGTHPTSQAFAYNYPTLNPSLPHYRLNGGSPVLDYPSSQFVFPPEVNGQPSPDSGVAHSSDGVPSGSESPLNSAAFSQLTINTNSSTVSANVANQQRPQVARSPFEWMKKLTYQSQPNPGKTRTKDKYRVVYTDHQRLELEKEFHYSRYITIRRKGELAKMLSLSERQVKIWFQNRRAKERKQTKKREEMGLKFSRDVPPHLQVVQDHDMRSNGSPLFMSVKSVLEPDSEPCPCS